MWTPRSIAVVRTVRSMVSVIARMASAGDIGVGDELHQRGLVVGIGQLAHVAIEIDHILSRPLLLIAHQFHRSFHGNSFEADRIAGAQLGKLPEIGGDDGGGLGIASGGLVFHEEDDGLPIGRRPGWQPSATAFTEHATPARCGGLLL